MFDYFCDGHQISAQNMEDAVSCFESLYGFTPEEVRPWTDKDQENLEWHQNEYAPK